jgi:hypothetical protein
MRGEARIRLRKVARNSWSRGQVLGQPHRNRNVFFRRPGRQFRQAKVAQLVPARFGFPRGSVKIPVTRTGISYPINK